MTKASIETASAKPRIPIVLVRNIPEALAAQPHWYLWDYERHYGRPNWTKIPKHFVEHPACPFIQNASSTNPQTWSTFQVAIGYYWRDLGRIRAMTHRDRLGIGFSLSSDNAEQTITCIDLDDARDRDTGELTVAAASIVACLNSYTEVSPSGTGLKIYALGRKPGARVKRPEFPGIEMFDNARFVAITGLHVPGTPSQIESRQSEIDALYNEIFPPQEEQERAARHAAPTTASAQDGSRSLGDHGDVLERARRYMATLSPAISGQGGHDATFRAACVLVLGFDLDVSDAFQLLAEWNATHCYPQWTDAELWHKIHGADAKSGPRGHIVYADKPFSGRGRKTHPDAADVPLDAPIIIEGWKTICGLSAVSSDGTSSGDGIASATSAYGPMPVQSLPLAEVMATIFTAQALTYYQTEQGSDGAEKERQLQAELAAAANQVEQRRRERATLCPHCDTAPQRRRDGQGGRVLFVGCDRWDCPVCRLNNIERWQLNFRIRIQNEPAAEGAPPGAMYEFWCPDSCWDSVRRAINAADGKYFRAAINGMVYCTVAPRTPHVEPGRIKAVDKADAIRLLCLAVEQTPLNHHRRHPITHSTGWGFPRVEDGAGLYVNVGKGPSGSQMLPAVRAILAHHGMVADERGPKSIFARIRHAVYFRFPDWWGERRKARVFGDLLAGEVMEDAEEVGPLVFVGDDGEPLRDADGSYVFRL